MSTTTFDETVEEKDLEIWTDNPMKLSFMCLYAAYKANQLLVLVQRLFTHPDCDLVKQFFTSVIRPHPEYANTVWHPFLKQDIQHIKGHLVPCKG